LAAESRLLAIQGKPQGGLIDLPFHCSVILNVNASVSTGQSTSAVEEEGSATDSEDEVEIIAETDADRRQALLDSEKSSGDLQKLSTKEWELLRDELESKPSTSRSTDRAESSSKTTRLSESIDDVIELSSSSEADEGDRQRARCDVPQPSGSVFTIGNIHPSGSHRQGKGKERADLASSTREPFGRGKLMQTQIDFGNKERGIASITSSDRSGGRMLREPTLKSPELLKWNCLVCTL
jgi:hypothetical protein